MKSRLLDIFNTLTPFRFRRIAPTSFELLIPQTVPHLTYVVGDIHGRLDLLQQIDAAIANDADGLQSKIPTTVYVGDYIDRGPDSAACLDRLCGQANARSHPSIHLMGNHEEIFLGFLDGDMTTARKWLMNGGRETLMSYGITPAHRLKSDSDIDDLREQALKKIPADTLDWLRALPRFHQIGDLVVVHAALDPEQPVEAQDPNVLTWGHPKFLTSQRNDNLWVAHGHTITRPASVVGRRVAVDTGAYRSGELTAAVFAPGHPVRFLSVSSDQLQSGG